MFSLWLLVTFISFKFSFLSPLLYFLIFPFSKIRILLFFCIFNVCFSNFIIYHVFLILMLKLHVISQYGSKWLLQNLHIGISCREMKLMLVLLSHCMLTVLFMLLFIFFTLLIYSLFFASLHSVHILAILNFYMLLLFFCVILKNCIYNLSMLLTFFLHIFFYYLHFQLANIPPILKQPSNLSSQS